MKAYSQDLRQRIVRAVEQGTPRSDVASLFNVSPSTIKRYLRQKREKGDIQPKRIPGRPPTKRAALQATLHTQLEAYPDATLQEHCEMWEAHGGITVSSSTMSRALQQFGWTRKKKRRGNTHDQQANKDKIDEKSINRN